MVSTELYELLIRNWRKIVGNGLDPISEIQCSYSPVQRPLPSAIDTISRRIASEIENSNSSGDHTRWNGDRFRLVEFNEGRTARLEEITLSLSFENSKYSDFLAMSEYLDGVDDLDGAHGSRRLHYMAIGEADEQVMPDLHSDFGVSLLIVTADNKLVLTRRKNLAVSPGMLHLSAHEGLSRGGEKPDLEDGVPSPAKAAVRAAGEELNLTVKQKDIEWLLFGHDHTTWEYNLFGMVHYWENWDDVRAAEALAKNAHLEHVIYAPVDSTPSAAVELLKSETRLTPQLLPCLFYAMVHLTGDPDEVVDKFELLTSPTGLPSV